MGIAGALAEALAADDSGLDEVKMGTPFGRLPPNHLMKNPAGTWSFVGSVDSRLSYLRKDGKVLGKGDKDILKNIGQAGPGMAGVKSRVFKTPYDAMMAAKKLNQGVTVSGGEMKKHPEIADGLKRSKVKHTVSGKKHEGLDALFAEAVTEELDQR